MSTKICYKCRTEVDIQASVCPACKTRLGQPGPGEVAKAKTSGCAIAAIIAIAWVFMMVIFGTCVAAVHRASTPAPSQANTSPQPAYQAGNATPWKYRSKEDKMGRGTVKEARCESTNTLSFDFPYSGPQTATLLLRNHPTHGVDAIVLIERGQFLAGVEGCTVHLRFDDGKPMAVHATGPDDHSTTAVFLSGASRIIPLIKKSKRMRIEATFFNEGSQIMEFDVSGLEW